MAKHPSTSPSVDDEGLDPGIYPYPYLRDGCIVFFGIASDRRWVADVAADGIRVTETMAKSLLQEILDLYHGDLNLPSASRASGPPAPSSPSLSLLP